MPTFYTNGAYLVPEVLADGRIAWVVSSFEDDTFADGVELETPNANEGGCLGEDDYHRHAERHASEETRDLSRRVCARQAEGVLHG